MTWDLAPRSAPPPPIFPPPDSPHHAEASEQQRQLITRSATLWQSPETLGEVLRGRGMFQRFRADLLAAHCRATLAPGI